MTANTFAAHSADAPFAPFSFERRDPQTDDAAIDILFCGVCHSDFYTARGDRHALAEGGVNCHLAGAAVSLWA